MPYEQLTMEERYQITYLHMHGYSNAEIARRLGGHYLTKSPGVRWAISGSE